MVYEFNQKISKMDEIKAEVQVLLPVLKAARAELGPERANRLILGALRAWCQERFRQIGAGMPGSPKEKWEAFEGQNMTRMRENDLKFEILRQDNEVIEYNVSHCIFADFFKELGEPELGSVLVCDQDFHVAAEIGSPDIEFARTYAIMNGDQLCDIHWRIKGSEIHK